MMWTDRFLPEVRSSAHLFYELGVSLRRRGHEVGVITRMPAFYMSGRGDVTFQGPVARRETLDGIEVIRVHGVPYRRLGGLARAADQFLMGMLFALASSRWNKPDVILVYSPPLPLAIGATLLGRWRRIPTVLNVQDLYPQTIIDLGWLRNPLAIRTLEAMERMAYRKASVIVVHSPGNQAFLETRRAVPPEKVRTIFNWVDTDCVRPAPLENEFRKKHGLSGKFVVSYAGVMGFGQDLTGILTCADTLRGTPEILFLLVGEGAQEARWRKMATELGLPNVRFLPMQPRHEYPHLLAASDACLVPLAGELRTPVVPGKLQSIMASGRPVVAIVPPDGDTPKIVADSGCGMSVVPGHAADLVGAIRLLHSDGELRSRMGAAGRSYAEKHFSLERCSRSYELLFEELLAKSEENPAMMACGSRGGHRG